MLIYFLQKVYDNKTYSGKKFYLGNYFTQNP